MGTALDDDRRRGAYAKWTKAVQRALEWAEP